MYYIDIHRLLRMLIGSKNTSVCVLGILYKVHIGSNHAAQQQKPALLRVLRNSPRAMLLSGYELVRPELTCDESALLRFL